MEKNGIFVIEVPSSSGGETVWDMLTYDDINEEEYG